MLGCSVIGLGVGEQHARTYAGMSTCTLRWLFDLDPARAIRLAAALPCARVPATFEEILTDPSTHLISLATYDAAHTRQAIAAMHAGKHIFVEKPLCRSMEELRSIQTAWDRCGRPFLSSNLVLRAAPLYAWLKHQIQNGTLGELYAIDGEYLYGRLHKITDGWRKDESGYSVLLGGGIHLADLMLWLTDQKPTRVFTAGNRIATAGTAFRSPDFAAATFQFPSGLVGRITSNFGCVHHHQHILRLFGTKATFVYDDQGPRLYTSRDPGSSPKRLKQAPLPDGKGTLLPGLVEDILKARDPAPRARREFDLMSVCLAADRSLAQGRPTEIEYV
jgi:predicted dehydrogenase